LLRLTATRKLLADPEVSYPAYYTRPFHGYDEGNLNWLAACELEASTESMSSGYFSDVSPSEGAARMRQTFASNIETFAAKHKARPLVDALDMGCSIGISTEETLARVASAEAAIGVDLSPYFLSIACLRAERADLPITYVHANIDQLDMPGSADRALAAARNVFRLVHAPMCIVTPAVAVVTAEFVFHEMPPEAIADTIRAAYRTLRPGGEAS
jgi:ubiquinone/menaquinone biosynthesis C-methylase UbiE